MFWSQDASLEKGPQEKHIFCSIYTLLHNKLPRQSPLHPETWWYMAPQPDLHTIYRVLRCKTVNQTGNFVCSFCDLCLESGRPSSLENTRTNIAQAVSQRANSTASDWKDTTTSCGPLLLQTHLKYPHADKPPSHRGGTGNSYWSLQITRASPVSVKAETSASFQGKEREKPFILNSFLWKPSSKLPFIIKKNLEPCSHVCGSFAKDVTAVGWTLEPRLWRTPESQHSFSISFLRWMEPRLFGYPAGHLEWWGQIPQVPPGSCEVEGLYF